MALDRQSIEKKDFPVGRRGYDPEAVDSHLAALADEIEELKSTARRRAETLASSASEQVRAIVEAAETSAAEIQRQAEEEAREIRAEAKSEADSTREQASAQARDYVGKVSESTSVMLQRLDAMESELGALIESLRTGGNRLTADLQLLEGNLSDVRDAASPRPRFEPDDGFGMGPGPEPAPTLADRYGVGADEPMAYGEPLSETDEPFPEDREPDAEVTAAIRPPEAEPTGISSLAAEGSDDTEGARLIALNMALNGTPRDETDRYLAENFRLADRDGLLDEVYASVEG
ncbi:MAG: DivIVA domain-containing protein [Solirubrobacterales bacterium]|nr:DivIVA domain-containing protein [Solirubrobacterales bacterium]MBV9472735.1 DivIVA domain-containing protein [Solirubrobacterales bacterium]MBV9837040.1 DivIVA domain-containing protein [Solirubrobacterales bacterium]